MMAGFHRLLYGARRTVQLSLRRAGTGRSARVFDGANKEDMMADDNDQLPEGTDKIVAGASRTDTSPAGDAGGDATVTTNTTLVTEKEVVAPKPDVEAAWTGAGRRNPSEARADDTTARSDQPLGQRLRDGGEKLSGQAADKARSLLGQGLERSSDALSNVGRMIGDTASGIDERLGSEYGDYARRAAGAVDKVANSLATKDPDELIDDTRNFVRKSPGVALAGAAVIGFAVARLLKSSLGSGSDDDRSSRRSNGDDG
jgi:hypothetical protein